MLKELLFPLTISLLVLLGTAAPVVDSQAFPHPIQARALSCQSYFGQGIQAGDCALALQSMGRMPITTTDPNTGRIVTFKGVFSRGVVDDRFRMPQRFVVGTCAIIVDLFNPGDTIVSNWAFAAAGAHNLVEKCALTAHIGGVDRRFGFDTLLTNPLAMNDRTRSAWDKYFRVIDDFGQLLNQMVQCIPHDLKVGAATTRAGVGRSSSTDTG